MVKNELSLNAQQTQKIATKMAEHKIENNKREGVIKKSQYSKFITFKSAKSEETLYQARKEILLDNLQGVYANNQDEADLILLKNNIKLNKMNWSLVKVDRNNPDREAIKKQIALNRYHSVVYEVNYARCEFEVKWNKIRFDKEIAYKLKKDKLCQEIYGENVPLERISYQQFYQNTLDEYAKIDQNCKKAIEQFLPLILKTVEESYSHTFAFEIKNELRNTVKEINLLVDEVEKNKNEICEFEIDYDILKEQSKEKINVADEISFVEQSIAKNKENIVALNCKIAELESKIKDLSARNEQYRMEDFELSIHADNEQQEHVLKDIQAAFKLPTNEIFNRIYRVIKTYILSLRPYFYDYVSAQEKIYQADNNAFRNENVKNLEPKVAKIYLNNTQQYLKHLVGLDVENKELLNTLNQQYLQEKEALALEEYKEREKIKAEITQMMNDFQTMKKSSKVSLKMADATKASEIHEVIKIHKKEIKLSKKMKYKALRKTFRRKKAELRNTQKLERLQKLNPGAVSIDYTYKKVVCDDHKMYSKEHRNLYRNTNKELKASRYRKNLTTKTRENGLGYLFLSIWAIGFIVFTLLPIIYTILMIPFNITWSSADRSYSKIFEFSFKDGLTFPNYVGGENFETLFLNNYTFVFQNIPRFFRSLLLFVPIIVFISFVLAMLLNSKIRGRTIFRIIYFLPVVIVSGPVLEMLNKKNTSGQSSIQLQLDGSSVAKILRSISPKALEYANEVFSNFIIILWLTGVPIILFISALQKINKQLYEAAEIDGANKWQMLWAVTFPLIKSVLLIVCIFTIMQVATINVDFVNPINAWIESKLSKNGENYSVVALGAWVQTIIVLLFVLVSFLLFREKEFISKDKNYEEIEEMKKKKSQRKVKIRQFFHVEEINHFFSKITAPIVKKMNERKLKKKEKEEMGG